MAAVKACDANQAVRFKIIKTEPDITNDIYFTPEMSYQIFGECEKIWGYSDLKIVIYYMARSLKTCLHYEYSEKFDTPPADNFVEKLKTWLSVDYLNDVECFKNELANDCSFSPTGEQVESFYKTTDEIEDEYVVHFSDFSNKQFQEYHFRFQSMIVFFIDAASKIGMDDPHWKCFTLYKKEKISDRTTFLSVGFCTVYQFSLISKIRPRISQFFILPPYQRKGLGMALLKVIYNYYKKIKEVCDITVEDPSPTFQLMRCIVDVSLAKNLPEMKYEAVKAGYTKEIQEALRKNFLFSSLQARCIYDIIRLAYVYIYDKKDYDKWREVLLRRISAQQGIGSSPLKKKQKLIVELDEETNKELENNIAECLKKIESDYSYVARRVFDIK